MPDKQSNPFDQVFMDAAWRDMTARLDEAMPTAPPRRRPAFWWWVMAGLLLLIVGLGSIAYRYSGTGTAPAGPATEPAGETAARPTEPIAGNAVPPATPGQAAETQPAPQAAAAAPLIRNATAAATSGRPRTAAAPDRENRQEAATTVLPAPERPAALSAPAATTAQDRHAIRLFDRLDVSVALLPERALTASPAIALPRRRGEVRHSWTVNASSHFREGLTGFGLGYGLSVPLGGRWELGAGLQYRFWSQQIAGAREQEVSRSLLTYLQSVAPADSSFVNQSPDQAERQIRQDIRGWRFNNHFLTLPLQVHYRLNPRLSVGAGAWLSYRLGEAQMLASSGRFDFAVAEEDTVNQGGSPNTPDFTAYDRSSREALEQAYLPDYGRWLGGVQLGLQYRLGERHTLSLDWEKGGANWLGGPKLQSDRLTLGYRRGF